jgi:hypothetical protein
MGMAHHPESSQQLLHLMVSTLESRLDLVEVEKLSQLTLLDRAADRAGPSTPSSR